MRREVSIPSKWNAMSDAQARALVNRFLLSQVGSQFCAGDPLLDEDNQNWCVPILFVTPGFMAGQVGEATISLDTGEMQVSTGVEEMYVAADKLRKRHDAAIKAAFLRTRRG